MYVCMYLSIYFLICPSKSIHSSTYLAQKGEVHDLRLVHGQVVPLVDGPGGDGAVLGEVGPLVAKKPAKKQKSKQEETSQIGAARIHTGG